MFARMTRTKWFLATALTLLAARPAYAASDEPFVSSTELGVTITANDVFDGIEESMTFWPAVRKHLASPEFGVADLAQRKEVVAYIRDVQGKLHDRLMGGDNAQGMDVLNFACWNLRRIHFMREMRGAINADDALPRLRVEFHNHYARLLREQGVVAPEQLTAAIEPQLKLLALPVDRHAQAMELWHKVALCLIAMEATGVGGVMREADHALDGSPAAELTRRVVAAADLASIMKPQSGPATKADFLAAWDRLAPPSLIASAEAPVVGQ